MRDAILGISAGCLLLTIIAFSGQMQSVTLQDVFEDYEEHKAKKSLEEQIERAKRTIEKNRDDEADALDEKKRRSGR